MQNVIGIDVSKAALDAYCEARGEHRQFGNNAAGLAAFRKWVSGRSPLIVFEASGAYHRALERMLSRRGLTFAKVNPRQARRFAEATGRVAKTDRLPSRDIACRDALPGNGCRNAGQNGTRPETSAYGNAF